MAISASASSRTAQAAQPKRTRSPSGASRTRKRQKPSNIFTVGTIVYIKSLRLKTPIPKQTVYTQLSKLSRCEFEVLWEKIKSLLLVNDNDELIFNPSSTNFWEVLKTSCLDHRRTYVSKIFTLYKNRDDVGPCKVFKTFDAQMFFQIL